MGPWMEGRIVRAKWSGRGTLFAEYDRAAESFKADAWMIGRISMAPYAGKARVPRRSVRSRIPRTDFIAARTGSYAIAIDPSGKLTWKSSAIDDAHVITVLTERVPDDYLAFLRSRGVSYLFGGKRTSDLRKVLTKVTRAFGIRKLLLEGGGGINGSFLVAGLIDELSVLVFPVADGSTGTPTLFDATPGRGPARPLRLLSVKRLKGGVVWLRYRF